MSFFINADDNCFVNSYCDFCTFFEKLLFRLHSNIKGKFLRVSGVFRTIIFIISTFLVADNSFSQTEFIENKGQWDSQVKFMSNAGNGAFFLRNNGFTVLQHNQKDLEEILDRHKIPDTLAQNALARPVKKVLHSHAYNVEFVNSNPSIEIIPDKPEPTVNNYFIGNDKTKWASNCRIFQGITYKNVYPNVDIRYYSDAGQRLKYDIIAHPGADINKIALKYKGADKLSIKNKELLISTSVGENKELYPYSYQVNDNKRSEVNCTYKVEGDVVKFKVKGRNPNTTLIIDPTEIFFSYTGSTADNWGFTATYGPDGSFFGGGIVFGQGFPVNPGAFETSYQGTDNDFDIGIIKLSPNGVNRIYATYIGGKGKEQPHSLIVDPQGNLILAGRTTSSDYPVTVPVYGEGGAFDIVVTKLNASGSALIGSMRIGGTENDGVNINDKEESGAVSLKRKYGDDARSEVIIDGSNNIYVASCTNSAKFPVTNGSFQTALGGQQDGVVLKLNSSCNAVLWSSYLGGSGDDACYVLALGNSDNLYVAGGTGSADIPSVSASGVISSANSGGTADGFVLELANNGSRAIRGTYLGTTAEDQIYGIQTDRLGFIYVMGTTEGKWHVENAPYVNANAKQFIAKIKPDLSAYVYSTTFGSTALIPSISPTAFLVDRCENVYVSGWGGKSNRGYDNSNVKGMPVTPNAIKPETDASGSDFYFFVLKRDAASQLYGTFFGQEDPIGSTPLTFGDHVDGGTSRFDKNGVIYQAICGNCFREVTFNGTPGVWSATNRATSGGKCNLGMLKIEMNFAGVSAGPKATINGVPNDTSGCIPLTVNFSDTLQKGKSYIWDFGDGSPKEKTTSLDISHTYSSTGKFRVMLVALDSSTCNIADTAYLTIKAGSNKASLDFISSKIPPCTNLAYNFTNTSQPTAGSFNDSSFTWDFGDNTSKVISGIAPVNHSYSGPGTYIVTLTLNDDNFCNSPADTQKTVRLSPQVKAAFVTPPSGCVPYSAAFQNTSAGGLTFSWDFGDGSPKSNLETPPGHLYSVAGSYKVVLIAYDPTSCNKVDSVSRIITVSPIPHAAFTYSPNPPEENKFTSFTNQSSGAIAYLWNYGDGDTSTEVNPRHIFNATGTYNVCLNARNQAGCSDDTCMPVSALIKPLLDVPNAFTPGKFGVNGIIKVRGFGIKNMQWNIYNRWGQLIFESTNSDKGWDGTFKGVVQPIDVYTYTLDVIFSDGKKLRKTGDITLLK